MFSARVEALLNLISNYENWESVRVDIVQTRADLLYRHAVRLGSLGIVEESTIEKLRDIVDLLVCRTEECSIFPEKPELAFQILYQIPQIPQPA